MEEDEGRPSPAERLLTLKARRLNAEEACVTFRSYRDNFKLRNLTEV